MRSLRFPAMLRVKIFRGCPRRLLMVCLFIRLPRVSMGPTRCLSMMTSSFPGKVFVYKNVDVARAQWFEAPAHIMGNNKTTL